MTVLATVLGVGASTPFGLDARQTAMFVRAGKFVARRTSLGARPGDDIGSARAYRLPDDVLAVDRICEFATRALIEAVSDASPDQPLGGGKPITALIALPELTRPFAEGQAARLGSNAFLLELERRTGVLLDHTSSEAVRLGHAGFAAMLERAVAHVGRGPVLVGAADSYHDPTSLAALVDHKRLLGEIIHNGFIPSEGAAFVVLGAPKAEKPALARLIAVATGMEPQKTPEEPRVAELMTELVRRVGGELTQRPAAWVLPDVNPEKHRVKEWSFASIRNPEIIEVPETREDHLYDETGDLGAATGALYACHAITGFRTGFAPAKEVLIALASDGDERGVFALGAAS